MLCPALFGRIDDVTIGGDPAQIMPPNTDTNELLSAGASRRGRSVPCRALAACACAAALALIVCAVAAGPLQDRPLIVGSEQDYPPFAVGSTDATAGGFTVERWEAVAEEEG